MTRKSRRRWKRPCAACAAGLISVSAAVQAQERLDPIVVTATRTEERAFNLPVAIDSIDAAQIQQNQLQMSLSESLARVPGIVAQSRWNYAQDLMLSIRGFGARANFGVRGIRLYQDGIPATMPDGQGQTSAFSLVSAKRIEVMRGPFSTLYGNASGGVIAVFTEDGPDPPMAQAQVVGGSYGTWNSIAQVRGRHARRRTTSSPAMRFRPTATAITARYSRSRQRQAPFRPWREHQLTLDRQLVLSA